MGPRESNFGTVAGLHETMTWRVHEMVAWKVHETRRRALSRSNSISLGGVATEISKQHLKHVLSSVLGACMGLLDARYRGPGKGTRI
ncbi:hypothetical protein E2C01_007346 [Portunus trituberculatus]|uniref:Uncharacterized protein n=1 Tax=Portunus trituberculatus TaxID=210409 RepID=A0A5B7CZ76_PORTR|nr:hypothetical protein [Portunus trituberculatus]